MPDGPAPFSVEDSSPSYPGAFQACRAKASGFQVNVSLCLIKPPWPCPYRKPFGENYVCQHPNHAAIVKLTNPTSVAGGNVEAPKTSSLY